MWLGDIQKYILIIIMERTGLRRSDCYQFVGEDLRTDLQTIREWDQELQMFLKLHSFFGQEYSPSVYFMNVGSLSPLNRSLIRELIYSWSPGSIPP